MSLTYKIVLLGYLVLRLKEMWGHQSWSLMQQNVLSSMDELAMPLKFS